MGGLGSGRRYHIGSKGTVDSTSAIDINYLKKQGLLAVGYSGYLSWSRNGHRTGSINFSVTEHGLILDYTAGKESFRYSVNLVYSSCNYGGQRPWLQCPQCYRRVGKLMISNKIFACRHCGDLAYQSQRDKDQYRYLNRAQNLRKRLGGTMNTLEPIPWKPKGMHWKTYRRIRNEIEHNEMRSWGAMADDMKRITRKLGS